MVLILLKSPLLLKLLSKDCIKTGIRQNVRNSHVVSYRSAPPPPSKATRFGAEVVSAAMWWWIFWHLWHEYEHITGEFPYPDPKLWTNDELGIPADCD